MEKKGNLRIVGKRSKPEEIVAVRQDLLNAILDLDLEAEGLIKEPTPEEMLKKREEELASANEHIHQIEMAAEEMNRAIVRQREEIEAHKETILQKDEDLGKMEVEASKAMMVINMLRQNISSQQIEMEEEMRKCQEVINEKDEVVEEVSKELKRMALAVQNLKAKMNETNCENGETAVTSVAVSCAERQSEEIKSLQDEMDKKTQHFDEVIREMNEAACAASMEIERLSAEIESYKLALGQKDPHLTQWISELSNAIPTFGGETSGEEVEDSTKMMDKQTKLVEEQAETIRALIEVMSTMRTLADMAAETVKEERKRYEDAICIERCELESKLSRASEKVDIYEKKNIEEEERIARQRETIEELEEKIRKLERELEIANEMIDVYEKEDVEEEETIVRQRATIKEQKEMIRALERELEVASEMIDIYEKEDVEEEEKIVRQQATIEEQKEIIRKLKRELEVVSEMIDIYEKEDVEEEEKIVQQHQEIEELACFIRFSNYPDITDLIEDIVESENVALKESKDGGELFEDEIVEQEDGEDEIDTHAEIVPVEEAEKVEENVVENMNATEDNRDDVDNDEEEETDDEFEEKLDEKEKKMREAEPKLEETREDNSDDDREEEEEMESESDTDEEEKSMREAPHNPMQAKKCSDDTAWSIIVMALWIYSDIFLVNQTSYHFVFRLFTFACCITKSLVLAKRGWGMFSLFYAITSIAFTAFYFPDMMRNEKEEAEDNESEEELMDEDLREEQD